MLSSAGLHVAWQLVRSAECRQRQARLAWGERRDGGMALGR
jgi:hypothetical protein